jgi:hypothetical protein
MTITAAGEFEDAEWVDEDFADLSGLAVQVKTVVLKALLLPVVDMTAHFSNPWTAE